MIDRTVRLNAIIHCLTIKHLQGDLIIVTENLMTAQPTNIPRLAKDMNTRNEEELSYMILTSSDKPALSNFAAEKKYFNVFPISGEFFFLHRKILTIQLFFKMIKQNLNDGLCGVLDLVG
jgi:hypothetical protein